MRKGFLKFIITVVLVIAIAGVIDMSAGVILDNISSKIATTGDFGKKYHTYYETTADVVVVGSSRAAHHYNSSIIEDSLHLSTFNSGVDGCFFLDNACVINSILDRYTPKLIIWEFKPEYLYKHKDIINESFPFYGQIQSTTEIIDQFCDFGTTTRLAISRLYRYNSKVLRILLRYEGNNKKLDPLNGFEPSSLCSTSLKKLIQQVNDSLPIDEHRKQLFIRTLKRVHDCGCNIVLANSPIYEIPLNINDQKATFISLCKNLNVPFFDNTHLSLLEDPKYFHDAVHLNYIGADIYTNYVISQYNKYNTNIRSTIKTLN